MSKYTIRSNLVHATKDPMDKLDKAGFVYKNECSECREAYVQETGRKFKGRFTKHHRSSSPIGQHMTERRHSIDNDSNSIMHSKSNLLKRGVAEEIHVREKASILSLGQERYTLPPIYSQLL